MVQANRVRHVPHRVLLTDLFAKPVVPAGLLDEHGDPPRAVSGRSKRPCGRGAWSDGETLVAAASFLPSCSVGEERAERDFLMRQGRTQQQREEKEDVHKRLACGSRVLELSCYGRA